MALYFLLHDADRFHQQIQPALGLCWQRRSFAPALSLVQSLLPAAEEFAQTHGLGESPLSAVVRGLTFDRARWRMVAGEVLWFSAVDVPEVRTAMAVTTWLLADVQEAEMARCQWPLIFHAYRGAKELVFGQTAYAPDRAGWSERDDVTLIADSLAAVEPARWVVDQLRNWNAEFSAEELQDELDDARDCFPALRDLYQRARQRGQLVICEEV